MPLPDEVRTSIIVAAAQAAGDPNDPGYEQRLEDLAVKLTTQASPKSRLSKRLDRIAESGVAYGVIESVTREESSTRGIVTLLGRPSRFHADGREQARTDRTDGADGRGLAMARRLTELVGHRVLLYVYQEPIGDGETTVRVVTHVEDLGVPRT